MTRKAFLVLLLGLVCCLFCASALAVDRALEPLGERPELPDRLATLLPEEGYRVLDGGAPTADFWLLSELPETEPSGEFGIDFGQVPAGALIGVVRFHLEWSDYKKKPVPPGLYTLRYGIQPTDGDHTGQSYFRDFVMLVKVEDDVFAAEGGIDQEPIVEASKKAAGTEHPAVLALYRIYDPVAETSLINNDFGEPCLAVPFGEVVMGLVLEGWGSGLQL